MKAILIEIEWTSVFAYSGINFRLFKIYNIDKYRDNLDRPINKKKFPYIVKIKNSRAPITKRELEKHFIIIKE